MLKGYCCHSHVVYMILSIFVALVAAKQSAPRQRVVHAFMTWHCRFFQRKAWESSLSLLLLSISSQPCFLHSGVAPRRLQEASGQLGDHDGANHGQQGHTTETHVVTTPHVNDNPTFRTNPVDNDATITPVITNNHPVVTTNPTRFNTQQRRPITTTRPQVVVASSTTTPPSQVSRMISTNYSSINIDHY